jgi:hypothetical protein
MDMLKAHQRFRFLVGDGVTTGEVHWGAVFAGAIVSLVGLVLWSLLGVGIGIAAIKEANPDTETVAWAGYAYWAITGIASAAAGGWTAGWAVGADPRVDRIEAGYQGFIAWALATLVLTFVVIGLAGSPLGITSVIGGPLALAAGTAAAAIWSFVALVLGALASVGTAYFAVGLVKAPAQTTSSAAAVMRPAE